ncbi:MAG: nitroreductase family protein [Patescibacteria group bacterium]|nr:nitroreductase family protein [Patescibacteria group bacterium]
MKTQEIINLKTSKTNIPINKIFKNRFSPRVFSNNDVLDKDLEIIFEAVRFSPSSYNLQPWYFYVAKKNSSFFERICSILMEGNKWAEKAPVLIIACYIKDSKYGENHYAQYDLGQAVATLVYQAQDLGYYTHQMAGFNHNKAKELVKDKNHIPWVVIALGKIGDYQKADEKLVKIDNYKPQRKERIFEII